MRSDRRKNRCIISSIPSGEYQTGEFLRQAYDLLQKAKMQTSPGTPCRLRVEKELITPIAVMLHHPQLQTGLKKESLLKEYEELRSRQISAYCDPGKQASLKKELAGDLAKFRLEIPTPEQFRHLPAERIRKFAYPVFSNVENDPDSVLGKAMASLKKRAGYDAPRNETAGGRTVSHLVRSLRLGQQKGDSASSERHPAG
jgi:hypothetical protein